MPLSFSTKAGITRRDVEGRTVKEPSAKRWSADVFSLDFLFHRRLVERCTLPRVLILGQNGKESH